ncbi:protein SPIRRIG-like isoform X1 [Zingiber officinale]|uniref:protein SPIRRIG-like isoform X1 n=2 Tax=Zingiber officinale TaxID=94328 RepID=UPI001C4BA019|nr:protein SPIRRIG-like isoform X1 [Zingiber officinale]
MFQSSRKTMKWSSLLKDLREKVGLSGSQSPSEFTYPSPSFSPSVEYGGAGTTESAPASVYGSPVSSPARGKIELELEFKKFWEEFRSSSSEKEKETALDMAVDAFCRLVKQQTDVAQLITKFVEVHIFSFVVGRAFVTDVEKLRIYSEGNSLFDTNIISFFSEVKDGLTRGSNLLYAVEVLVTAALDKQSLLDSGILCCLIHILNALLNPRTSKGENTDSLEDPKKSEKNADDRDAFQIRQLEIEGSIVHIMKALASHPSAALSLIEDDSLQLLLHMVANGSLNVFAQFKEGLVPLHTIQLHRHAMQVLFFAHALFKILGLLLANDNGSTAKYIRKHHLIKVLLMAVKDFNAENGDAAYTMGIVDLLLESVELSYRPEAGSVRLREDIHNAHGYQFLVQFALTLSSLKKDQVVRPVNSNFLHQASSSQLDGSDAANSSSLLESQSDTLPSQLSPALTRLLDVLVNLAQTGQTEPTCAKSSKHSQSRSASNRSYTSFDKQNDEEKGNAKVKDLEAIQMLQDIFLKADNVELQAEVLNRLFKIFSCHLDNYMLCQQLRTLPLFILNMASFPASLQEIVLKILEYAVTVVNCTPEQELLSLCCLLQQPISFSLKHIILAFFVKLLSFDQKYKKVLREVGVLEVLLDDLKQNRYFSGREQQNSISSGLKTKSNTASFKRHIDNNDIIFTSPKPVGSASGKYSVFEDEGSISVAWDCLFSLLRRAESNQQAFRASDGVNIILPFLISDHHRAGVLRLLSCLIIEDALQDHPEELGALIEILKSDMVTSSSGSQYKLQNDAKCDILGALWRILGANNAAQRVFGDATGFSLLLTTLHGFQSSELQDVQSSLSVFSFLMRAITAGVSNNPVNRLRLHAIMLSQTIYDLLCESGLLCVECENQVIQLMFELALETILPPSSVLGENYFSFNALEDDTNSFLTTSLGISRIEGERIYNASAVAILVRSLLLFTPKVQLDILRFIDKLARAGPFNQENLTSVGCIAILLETICPFLEGSSPLLTHALRIVEVLGAFRLSSSELRILVRYILLLKTKSSANLLVDMMEKLLQMEDSRSEGVSLAPFVEMDMSKVGHASIQVSLGERTWPPAAGYTFVCWFQYRKLFKNLSKESEQGSKTGSSKKNASAGQVLRIFSVGAVNDGNTLYAELYLHDNGVLTLATSSSCSLSFPGIELEEGKWYHLAIVHSKPNALAGLFQASMAYVYINGKLMHTGKLGYSLSPVGKSLQVTLGTPAAHAKISDFSWRLRCCYLFEEVLTSGSIFFMYILGRGYRGLFQDTDLLRFAPNQACGGGSMAILYSLESELPVTSNSQRLDNSVKQGTYNSDRSGIVWDLERLTNFSLQLSGKKLIFAFDGTSSETYRASGTLSLVNLVDPTSAAASPIGGIPRYGRLSGDVYICNHFVIGDSVRVVGGIPVVLALIEAAETKDMLHMVLELLACSLHQSPQNVKDMQALRGYHLLALFLQHKMLLFDMHSLDIFFHIAACEASFAEPQKLRASRTIYHAGTLPETSIDDLSLPKFSDDFSSVGSHGEMDDISVQKDSFSLFSELENTELSEANSNCIVLSNADMVEHVLLDWTLWVEAPVPIQIALLGFLERMVSMHWYRNHNLTILRRINLVRHLLVTLQRGDVEVIVLEKLVVLLGVILEDGFLASELELVIRFVIMTFDPPELTPRSHIIREPMGKHVIVRNMLLEMLIDLQVTIGSEELLEHWHKIVSSKLIAFFLDEAVHPTSMRWIMTLLGVCLSSPTFALKFRISGGYQGLSRVLPSFHDSPEIYYILFCLIFGKDVYPRVPEVRMLDFFALLPNDGNFGELKFVELLETVVSMAKATFDQLSMQSMLAHQEGKLSLLSRSLVAELVDATTDTSGDLQGEALLHKTYAARLMGGEAGAPIAATSILRFMVDLAKTCPPFSSVCRRAEFLESCVDLYFSCVRADCALKMAKDLAAVAAEVKNDVDDDEGSENSFLSLPLENAQSVKTSMSAGSYLQEHKSTSSGYVGGSPNHPFADVDLKKSFSEEGGQAVQSPDAQIFSQMPVAYTATELKLLDSNGSEVPNQETDSLSTSSINMPSSPALSDNSNTKSGATSTASPVLALTSWLGSTSTSDSKVKLTATPSMRSSFSLNDESSPDLHESSATSMFFPINSKLLLEIDDSGYGGGPCSAGATAVLDFIAEILADIVSEQLKATQLVENILESVPLYVDIKSTLVFQGLCLSRLMNFLERRLLRDDEDEQKLDKNRWTVNLDSLCWMIVDQVYMGSFPEPISVFRILEFLLSMLQLANKDGRVEEAAPGKGILSIARGTKQLEAYVHAILKNTNRIIMYCFLPTFLNSIGEGNLFSVLNCHSEGSKGLSFDGIQDESTVDICTILQLLSANKRLILCPSNLDTDLISCLCVNLIALLNDKRSTVRNQAVDIIKYLLLHRRPAVEEFLVSKPNQGLTLDVLHDGFDKLLTGNSSTFFDWFQNSHRAVNKVLEQCSSIMWMQYVAGSAKFPGVRIKGMEVRRKRDMSRKARDSSKINIKHWEQIYERRNVLESGRDLMSTELRAIRQDKYGWVLHAESEWQTHLQQLVHERGIFPVRHASAQPEWQLCPIEGPYRMRKKLERSRLKIDTIQNILAWSFELEKTDPGNEKHEIAADTSGSESDSYFNLLSNGNQGKNYDGADHEDILVENDGSKIESLTSVQIGWNDDFSNMHQPSVQSATEVGGKSSSFSVPMTYGKRSELGSPRQIFSFKVDEVRISEDKQEKEQLDNGEYLVRPFLEPSEKLRFSYNCERVVGLDKHDGIFLIGDFCLYIIENFYIDDSGCICEKASEDDLSVIDQALGVKKDTSIISEFQEKSPSTWDMPAKTMAGGRAWAYNGGAWGKEKVCSTRNLSHPWHMWKLDSICELLKRDYQLRPVAIEVFSMDGCNDLLVFHKKEREEVFKNLVAMNLPRNSMLDSTISGSSKKEGNEGSRLFKIMAKSFSKRWQTGEISNFQYLMHLNTLAGRGYSDLTQYPVFPWILADYVSENLDLKNPQTFRKLDKPMGCQTAEGEEEFKKRYETWDDPDVPKFHYGSHYSSAGIVLFYLVRLPPFSAENQKLQGGQFDHADRLFNSVRDTWSSAAGKSNTSDVKELIPEFFYMPEFLENHFNLDLGEKQSGEKVCNVVLPPWAKGSPREFIRRHREALESDYVSENLHHWIDLIFGYKQRGKAAEEATNVFYHYTYEGNVDIDSITDPTMKASILAQINHFGQTPKQLFQKPHPKRRTDRKIPPHPLRYSSNLVPQKIRRSSSFISQIVTFNEKVLVAKANSVIRPVTYNKYISWGFPDRSLRILSYDQDKLLSTHENLHCGSQIQCAGVSHDGQFLVTGADDGVVAVWRFDKDNRLSNGRALCAHTGKITCIYVSQSYSLIVTGSDDCSVILWDLTNLAFVKQLPLFPAPISAVHVNELTGVVLTAAGILLAIWSVNGDCLAVINTSQLPSDFILSVTSVTHSDWQDTNWFATGHQSGAVKVWNMLHYSTDEANTRSRPPKTTTAAGGLALCGKLPEYNLILHKVLKSHKHPVTALHVTSDLKQMLSGDSSGHLLSWTVPDDSLKASGGLG